MSIVPRFIPKGTPTADGSFGTAVLPEIYAQRRSNRGFEGVAIEGTKLYLMDNGKAIGTITKKRQRVQLTGLEGLASASWFYLQPNGKLEQRFVISTRVLTPNYLDGRRFLLPDSRVDR